MIYKFPLELREGLKKALPQETAEHGTAPNAQQMYLPVSHSKALHPDNTLIQGMRGSGKSFWFLALQKPDLLKLIGTQVGLGTNTLVTIGFGAAQMGNEFPVKDTLIQLLQNGYQPRFIWKAVVFHHVASDRAPQEFQALTNWESRIQWVRDRPEEVAQSLYDADKRLEENQQHHIVLFDALDRTADDWPSMNQLVKGLLQLALETLSSKRIRLKIFARPDQLGHPSVADFPDASKIITRKVTLDWSRCELYGLLWQYLANDPSYGERFRIAASEVVSGIQWAEIARVVWQVPDLIRNDETTQKLLFHAITGPWMGKDKRRGFPYSWLYSHLGDADGKVSPRSFLAAMLCAAEDNPRDKQEYLLHFESIKKGVQTASGIRVQELQEDYSWVEALCRPLAGINVPCSFDEICNIWKKTQLIEQLRTSRLPPPHIDQGEVGVLQDLLDLKLFEQLKDKRINLPDVYRVGYGMGRRGGVKPYGA